MKKHITRSELKKLGLTREQYELQYEWLENGCKSYNGPVKEGTESDFASKVYVTECTFKTDPQAKKQGIGVL